MVVLNNNWAITYRDGDNIRIKEGFKTDTEAIEWIECEKVKYSHLIPLQLSVYSYARKAFCRVYDYEELKKTV